MSKFEPAATLRAHRPLLLAMEAVGWLHMAGKARAEFLREQGGKRLGYDYRRWHETETPPFPWHDLLEWGKTSFARIDGADVGWPGTLTDFLTKHRDPRGSGLLGLLQAGHAMASGIEKNLPRTTSEYLAQDTTHLWLSSVFGHPVRNLLLDPSEILTAAGWKRLVVEIRRVLEELKSLGTGGTADARPWQHWREAAIGPAAFLRHAFSSTLAETRLPNNDVTLWDQSYVAAALFKSAVAGAVLEGNAFSWTDAAAKQKTRWRLWTVGIGADHYEARAVRIGDWTGTRLALDDFFDKVQTLVEVDLGVGPSSIARERSKSSPFLVSDQTVAGQRQSMPDLGRYGFKMRLMASHGISIWKHRRTAGSVNPRGPSFLCRRRSIRFAKRWRSLFTGPGMSRWSRRQVTFAPCARSDTPERRTISRKPASRARTAGHIVSMRGFKISSVATPSGSASWPTPMIASRSSRSAWTSSHGSTERASMR